VARCRDGRPPRQQGWVRLPHVGVHERVLLWCPLTEPGAVPSEVSKGCSRRTRVETHRRIRSARQVETGRPREARQPVSSRISPARVSAPTAGAQPVPWQKSWAGECVGGAASSFSTRTTWFSATTAGAAPQTDEAVRDQHHLDGNFPAEARRLRDQAGDGHPTHFTDRSTASMTRCPGRSNVLLAAPWPAHSSTARGPSMGGRLSTIPSAGPRAPPRAIEQAQVRRPLQR
jgi:hypothetical protein